MILKDENNIYLIFYFFRLCQEIDNCFYDLGNVGNTPKFALFHI